MANDLQNEIRRGADIIAGVDVLEVAAGIGVDSGLPDFRGNDGFWRAYPALAASGIAFTEVASPRSFHLEPTLVWGFCGHRLNLYRKTAPRGNLNC
jgi:NAD-dependent SIR2 family protein deacetylase